MAIAPAHLYIVGYRLLFILLCMAWPLHRPACYIVGYRLLFILLCIGMAIAPACLYIVGYRIIVYIAVHWHGHRTGLLVILFGYRLLLIFVSLCIGYWLWAVNRARPLASDCTLMWLGLFACDYIWRVSALGPGLLFEWLGLMALRSIYMARPHGPACYCNGLAFMARVLLEMARPLLWPCTSCMFSALYGPLLFRGRGLGYGLRLSEVARPLRPRCSLLCRNYFIDPWWMGLGDSC